VLVTLDSLRADHCSCYGYEKDTTPFLSRLAQKGIKFENVIVSGVPTVPSSFGMVTSEFCPISLSTSDPRVWRAAIMKRKTIFEVLSNHGYHTGVFTPHPFFSSYYGFTKGCEHEYADFLKSMGKYERIKKSLHPLLRRLGIFAGLSFIKNIVKGDIGGYTRIEDFYSHIVNWVNNKNPYFLWVFMVDTHSPYLLSKGKDQYSSECKRRKVLWVLYKIRTRSQKLSEDELKLIISCYDSAIKYADAYLKQLWNDLKDTDPIFIVNADHGEAFGEHGFYGHPPEHYEYLIRVPLIIYNADVKGVVEEPISLLRLAPTICELAGVENEFSQPSLLEDVEYTPPIVENKLENGLRVTVRDKEWKLIVNPDREDELYNIKKDPMEQENLIGQEPDIEKELRKLAEKHIKTRKEKERLRKRIKRLRGI